MEKKKLKTGVQQVNPLEQESELMLKKLAQQKKDIHILFEQSRKYNYIDPEDFARFHVKRGLRNEDGTGVLAGITKICNVHGYIIDEGDKIPVPGALHYRGISVEELVHGCQTDDRFGFEEVAWLLLFGQLPTEKQLKFFQRAIARQQELPDGFIDDNIITNPSRNIMNALGRCVLALYNYDEDPDDLALENQLRQSIALIARLPLLMVAAYQVKRRTFDRRSMYFHRPKPDYSIAQNILRTLRSNKHFEDREAKMLDMCLILHAEHGGGNNSTFSARVLTSTSTDIYSAVSAGIGSLKGPRHGGANAKVLAMMEEIKANVSNWESDDELAAYLRKILKKEAGDGSGLIYGMGHAVYTISDPRAILLRDCARSLAKGSEYEAEFALYESVERLTPAVFAEIKKITDPICANVDMYSGIVYRMLGIPDELITPMFAVSRTVGWCAHRMEEILNGGKIMRPAYKVISPKTAYTPLVER